MCSLCDWFQLVNNYLHVCSTACLHSAWFLNGRTSIFGMYVISSCVCYVLHMNLSAYVHTYIDSSEVVTTFATDRQQLQPLLKCM